MTPSRRAPCNTQLRPRLTSPFPVCYVKNWHLKNSLGRTFPLDMQILETLRAFKAATAADDNGRMRKVLDARAQQDEEKLGKLEDELKTSRTGAEDADKKYEEIAKKR